MLLDASPPPRPGPWLESKGCLPDLYMICPSLPHVYGLLVEPETAGRAGPSVGMSPVTLGEPLGGVSCAPMTREGRHPATQRSRGLGPCLPFCLLPPPCHSELLLLAESQGFFNLRKPRAHSPEVSPCAGGKCFPTRLPLWQIEKRQLRCFLPQWELLKGQSPVLFTHPVTSSQGDETCIPRATLGVRAQLRCTLFL